MKTSLTEPVWVDPNMKMQYTSNVLDLETFAGHVTIKGCTFSGIII